MTPRIARNLLELLRPDLERANALLEAARALQALITAGAAMATETNHTGEHHGEEGG